jgi:hypothetical protein
MRDDNAVYISPLRFWLACIICKIFGHRWGDFMPVPEDGDEIIYLERYCKRCGLWDKMENLDA